MKLVITMFLGLLLALPLYAANVLVAPGDPIPGDVSGTITLLAGEHTTDTTVEITTSMTLTAEPGAVWISTANPVIAVHANDVTISHLTLRSADPTTTAIVSGSPVTLKRPSHCVHVLSNTIEGFISGVQHVYGDGFVAKDNIITGVGATLDPFEIDTVGILNTMGSNAIIEGNTVSGFLDGIFLSGSHGHAVKNRFQRDNAGVLFCNWYYPVPGEPDLFQDLVANNSGNYWDVHENEISDGVLGLDYFGVDLPAVGVQVIDGANHNLVYGNLISGVDTDIILFGSLTPFASALGLFPKTYENVVVVAPGQTVVENLEEDEDPSYGNVLLGFRPIDEAGTALLNDVLQNAGPRAESATDYSNVFFTSLSAGLNMMDIPLKPIAPYTARSLAEELDATVVIRLNTQKQLFEGFALGDSSSGFPIEGGQGYIVNVKAAKQVAFVGAAWTNTPSIEAAPTATSGSTGWAFVVSGELLAMPRATVSVRNTTTGAVATSSVDADSGHFSVAWADLSRQSVIHAGDRLELSVTDASGRLLGRTQRLVSPNDVRDAYLRVTLRREDVLPTQTQLMQNYPNPFNPETWIPFELGASASVAIVIYDAHGRVVRTLDMGHRPAGIYQDRVDAAYWDGRNAAGESVASGVYLYQLRAGDVSQTRRMVILK